MTTLDPEPRPQSLDALREEFLKVARTERGKRRSRLGPSVLALAGVLVAASGGYAVGQALRDDGVSAGACPDANAVYQRAGLPPPDVYIPVCPDPKVLQGDLNDAFVENERLEEISRALETGRITENQDPAEYPPDLQP